MKNWLVKICSLVLSLAILFEMIPAQVLAAEQTDTAEDSSTLSQAEEVIDSEAALEGCEVVTEIEESRTEFSKEYKLSNGLNMLVVYPESVHYEENGQWKDIDNSLELSSAGRYSTRSGSWQAEFPSQLADNTSISITKDGYAIHFAMAGELRLEEAAETTAAVYRAQANVKTEKTVVNGAKRSQGRVEAPDYSKEKERVQYPEIVRDKLRSRMAYTDVYGSTDIIYDVDPSQVKESVVIERYDEDLQGYQYYLNIEGMTPVLNEDGSIDLIDPATEAIAMTMPAPYMVDHAGEVSTDVTVALERNGNLYVLTYKIPTAWLASNERQWPVILDPVIEPAMESSNILDRTVVSEGTTTYIDGSIMCGYTTYAGWGNMRTYVKYANLPTLTSADVIVNATFSLLNCGGTSETTTTIEAHKVTQEWISESISWANQPTYESLIEDYARVAKDLDRHEWDVTDIARSWYADGNYGLVLKVPESVETGGTADWKQFYSIDYDYTESGQPFRPYLTIVYRNANGLESYWDYTTNSAGRAGTGYVNNYTGNLVWVHDDIGFDGNRMPVSISHVYNANDSAENSFGLGYGWRTNYHQSVKPIATNNTDAAFVWTDSDGTKHYFVESLEEDIYCDEDGLELTLRVNSNGSYSILDNSGNESLFDSIGRLIIQTNNQQSQSGIMIAYTDSASNKISQITDGAGRVYKFVYNSNNLLTKILYYGTGTTILGAHMFSYSSSRLTLVTARDGKSISYAYDANNLLTSTTDVDGYRLQYTYSSSSPYRVVGIAEYDGDTQGGSLAIEYAQNQTTFKDHNNQTQITQFNDWGNVISIQDGQGHAEFAQYAVNDYDDTTGAKGNQLTLTSKMQNTVGNRFKNNDFEIGSDLTVVSGTGSQARTTQAAYHGSKSLTITNDLLLQTVALSIAAGRSETFSAYVKTDGTTAQIEFYDGTNTYVSEILAAGSDWTRLQVTYANTGKSAITVRARIRTEGTGTTYVDSVQWEYAASASRYNLVMNGDFRNANAGWSLNAGRTTQSPSAAPELSINAYKMVGTPTAEQRIYQTVLVAGAANDSFVLSGWAKGDSAPLSGDREFAVIGTFNYTDGSTSEPFVAQFNPDADSSVNWQYSAQVMIAEKAYSSIKVELAYDYNVNTVYFDGIQLFKEQFGNRYSYDDYGNIVSTVDLQGQETEYEYVNNDLKEIIQSGTTKKTYTYDDHHNVKTATTSTGVTYEFEYDLWGNNTSVSIVSGDNRITSSAEYTTDGNYLLSTTDAAGNKTEYGYNTQTGVLEWVKYPEDTTATRTEHTYDSMYRLAAAVADVNSGYSLNASYTYTDDLLTEIETNSTTYSFAYGDFAQTSSIKIGDWTLATYAYTQDQNRYLQSLDYGNGDSVQYDYDDYGRLVQETYEDGDAVTYTYDNTGALATVTDSATGIKTTYYYDLTDQLAKFVESGNGYYHSVSYEYDSLNNLAALVENINGTEKTTEYTYDTDNRIASVSSGDTGRTYTYDAFGRLSSYATSHDGTNVLTETIIYDQASRVSDYQFGFYGRILTYTYTYDDNGNITAVYEGVQTSSSYPSAGTNGYCIAAYTYDSANQLIREDNQAEGWTRTWTYDDAGNITSRSEYAYTTGTLGTPTSTVAYGYSDTVWGDLLISYNGNAITYDGVGNPLSDGTWTYTWEHGRQLAGMTDGTNTWTYTYDANGIRTSRSNGTTTYNYVYNGSQLMQMTVGDAVLDFTYDASGRPMTLTFDGATYYYAVNPQGDVLAILDSTGAPIVTYTYDAWGNQLSGPTSGTGSVGQLNPLRYRGYVYDQDTGLYYLQSRYYNPEIGRFLNADVVYDLDAGLEGYNLFLYCANDPVNRIDVSGTDSEKIADLDLDDDDPREYGGGGRGFSNFKTAAKSAGKAAKSAIKILIKTSKAVFKATVQVVSATIKQSRTVARLIKNASELNRTKTVMGHASSRPYTGSTLTIKNIMSSAKPVKDASLKDGLKWVVPGSFNGTSGVWELVIDCITNTIVHFLFRS